MIEAWLRASVKIASSGVEASVGITPTFASQQLMKVVAASQPMNAQIFRSNSRWQVIVPQMKRTEAVPMPNFSMASRAAASTLGWSARPR